MKKILSKLKRIYLKVEHRVPYIPDFRNITNILKVIFISLLLSVIYTFAQIDRASIFYEKFWQSLQIFSPYVLLFLFLIVITSKMTKAAEPPKAILFILMLNLFSVYVIDSLIIMEFYNIIKYYDQILHKFATSIGVTFFFLVYFDWTEKSIHPSQLRAQLSFLQSKMRPHFLFNTLNSIVSLVKSNPDLAKKMILNLSALLRASLKDNNLFMHTIKEEVSLCKKYLEIESIRMGDRLNVNWNFDEKAGIFNIPKLSIQPLIENSILHGIQTLDDGGEVNVDIRLENNNRISILITNPKNSNIKLLNKEIDHNNIGIKNLEERLFICFDGDVEIVKTSLENSFTFYINIPTLKGQENI